MEGLWKKIHKTSLFLVVNTVCWMLIGLLVWGVVRVFAFDALPWALCFMGYPGFFIGFIGGIFFLWNKY